MESTIGMAQARRRWPAYSYNNNTAVATSNTTLITQITTTPLFSKTLLQQREHDERVKCKAWKVSKNSLPIRRPTGEGRFGVALLSNSLVSDESSLT
jgi:hypothetical protein